MPAYFSEPGGKSLFRIIQNQLLALRNARNTEEITHLALVVLDLIRKFCTSKRKCSAAGS